MLRTRQLIRTVTAMAALLLAMIAAPAPPPQSSLTAIAPHPIWDRSGNLEFTGDLSKTTTRGYTLRLKLIGTWTYEIRGFDKVPGIPNTWTGNPSREP
jgi:hypothetical protein